MRWMMMAALACGWVGCAPDPEPRPTPPNMTALLAQYAAPSGTVTRESAQALLEDAATELALIQDADVLIDLMALVFSDLGGALDEDSGELAVDEEGLAVRHQTLKVGGINVDAGAWIVYHRLCPTANGTGTRGKMQLTALIEDTGFEPVIWGKLLDCRAEGSALDGDLALHIDWVDGAPQSVLANIDGIIKLGDAQQTGNFSVRWDADAVLTQYTLAGRTFLLGIDSETSALVLEGENGRYVCDAQGCDGPEGGFAW
jgi:hypothetical protein